MRADKVAIAGWKAQGIRDAIASQKRRPVMIDDRTGLVYLCAANLHEFAHHLEDVSVTKNARGKPQ